MIRYKRNVIDLLTERCYSTYYIKEKKIFNQSQLQGFRSGKIPTQDVMNRLCALLNLQPGDILEYVPDGDTVEILKQYPPKLK